MNDAKVKFGSLSLNNQYQVHFAGFNGNVIRYLKFNRRMNNAQDFISREAGLLCSDASLPASAFATAEVKDNFMGIPQELLIPVYTLILILHFMLMMITLC